MSATDRRALAKLLDTALADHRAGRLDAAKARYREILRLDPAQASALHLLGQITFIQGDPQSAIAMVRQAVANDRRNVDFRNTLTSMFLRLGQGAEAEAEARGVLKLDRTDIGAMINLGLALMARMALGEAESILAAAVKRAPDNPVALANLGAVQQKAERPAAARDTLERAVTLAPGNAAAWGNLAAAAAKLGDPERAAAAAEHALTLDPGNATAHAVRGDLLFESNRVTESIVFYERAAALRTDDAVFAGKLANAYMNVGRAKEALAMFDRARALAPDDRRARYNMSLCQLMTGDLDAGLENYEARLDLPELNLNVQTTERPVWQPNDASDIRLLVTREQGIGDQILNAVFLDAARRRGMGAIMYQCDARLVALLERSVVGIGIVSADLPPPEHDRQIAAGSFHRALRSRGGEPEIRQGWLRPDPTRLAHFRAQLASLGAGPWIGLSLRSERRRVEKSMPLAEWAPILRLKGLNFVNLQYGDTNDDIAAVSADFGVTVHTNPDLDRFADIDGLAALTAALDGVVTISNVTAHISGAIGLPTLVALQKVPLWYWGLEAERSPYYPSLRLFRQREAGGWLDVAERIAAALAKQTSLSP